MAFLIHTELRCTVNHTSIDFILINVTCIFDYFYYNNKCAINNTKVSQQSVCVMFYVRLHKEAVVIYRVIHKSVKHFKNSQQIKYTTDHGCSWADGGRNSPSFFFTYFHSPLISRILATVSPLLWLWSTVIC